MWPHSSFKCNWETLTLIGATILLVTCTWNLTGGEAGLVNFLVFTGILRNKLRYSLLHLGLCIVCACTGAPKLLKKILKEDLQKRAYLLQHIYLISAASKQKCLQREQKLWAEIRSTNDKVIVWFNHSTISCEQSKWQNLWSQCQGCSGRH